MKPNSAREIEFRPCPIPKSNTSFPGTKFKYLFSSMSSLAGNYGKFSLNFLS